MTQVETRSQPHTAFLPYRALGDREEREREKEVIPRAPLEVGKQPATESARAPSTAVAEQSCRALGIKRTEITNERSCRVSHVLSLFNCVRWSENSAIMHIISVYVQFQSMQLICYRCLLQQ
jgi:hypothetical protein